MPPGASVTGLPEGRRGREVPLPAAARVLPQLPPLIVRAPAGLQPVSGLPLDKAAAQTLMRGGADGVRLEGKKSNPLLC